MRTVAFTRVRDDEQKLETWLSYYSRYFDDLHVMGCNIKPGIIEEMSKKYNFGSTLTEVQLHSVASLEVMSNKQIELLKDHEWVFYSDMDEIVMADPEKYRDLRDFMNISQEKQTYCEGYWLYKAAGEKDMDWTKPILTQRHSWWKDSSGSYNKPLLSRVESKWVHGFHYLREDPEHDPKTIADTGLYLLHLKQVNEYNDDNHWQDTGGLKTPIPEKFRGIV